MLRFSLHCVKVSFVTIAEQVFTLCELTPLKMISPLLLFTYISLNLMYYLASGLSQRVLTLPALNLLRIFPVSSGHNPLRLLFMICYWICVCECWIPSPTKNKNFGGAFWLSRKKTIQLSLSNCQRSNKCFRFVCRVQSKRALESKVFIVQKKGGNVKTIPPYKPVPQDSHSSDSSGEKEGEGDPLASSSSSAAAGGGTPTHATKSKVRSLATSNIELVQLDDLTLYLVLMFVQQLFDPI